MLSLDDPQYALLPLVGRTLLAAFFLYVYRRRRELHLLYWAAGWGLLALQTLPRLLTATPAAAQPFLEGVDSLVLAFAVLLFLDSTRVFSRASQGMALGAFLAPVFVLWLIVSVSLEGAFRYLPLGVGSGAVLLAAAVLFWREGRQREVIGGSLLAGSYFLWGLAFWVVPLTQFLGRSLPLMLGFVLSLPQYLVAFSMVIVLYESEKRNMERHLLGLAGLNLITSTAQQAATVQDMLGHTLERLLGALRIPAGTAALAMGDNHQLVSIHRGESGDFLRAVEQHGLLPYLHETVRRLGGLVVLPDLNSPVVPAAFARQREFEELTALARANQIRLLAGVSLRARTGDRGVLLLASPDSRRFAPPELRLLLGLGGQIGMAVENYQLMQESSRRTEELRLLNEIGRALSSSRNVDELLGRIHAEMKKVIDVSNFYVAFYDPLKDEVCFELEVKDNSFLPKRRRRARNGLTEYVLRRKEPVLIRKDFSQVVKELGVEPGRSAQGFCAVPLLLHGEALGVIGIVSYTNPEAFEERHVEILTTLAAETAVAIENARLFSEEQKRGQQLTLLNNVSRQAIATLNPEEMLTAIASEVHSGLQYDYVGLGILDYANREVVIQAEGGSKLQGPSRRFKLGEGVVGQVAMSGTARHIDNLAAHPDAADCLPLLPGAQSLVALPIIYGDQLLGVLEVESRKPLTFREEDILLLRTLADQVASALQNALAFQKAQEQAITDGLTGVKTHRFFMEGLNAEWRRSTRVGRSFSLVLLDLDTFKFVNDYFGHLEGDTVLQQVGRILEQNVRRSDVVARYGGDEFVILMPETNGEQAFQLADKLRLWLANDPLLREKKVTASMGIATFPRHATTPPELIKIADASMYLSKHQGGNMVVSADHYKMREQRHWQRDVLEAYLGVTIKRLFATGPEAFDEVYHRLQQVINSLGTSDGEKEVPTPVLETVTSLAFAIDAKDHYTQGHSQNVARYSLLVARHLSMREKEVEELRLSAVLHDVGKIGIPERILNKPGPLDPQELEIMKEHAVLGAKILEPLRSLQNVQKNVRHHHERWDGKGYPDGLRGDKTPLAARLIAIADAYDTMITERTYKRSRSRVEALEELRRCAATQFDPKLVEAFVEAIGVETRAEAQGEQPPVAHA